MTSEQAREAFGWPLYINLQHVLKLNFLSKVTPNSFNIEFPIVTVASVLGGGGVPWYCSWYGDVPFFMGTFFKPLRNYGYHFHNFLTFHGIMGVLFRGFFIMSGRYLFNLWNYGPKIQQNLRNYGYQSFGQNGTSPSHNRLSYPPPPLPSFSTFVTTYH